MSLFEILLILAIALLVMKPEDIPKIAKTLMNIKRYIDNTKKEIISYIDLEPKDSTKSSVNTAENEVEQMNFYLQKIADLDDDYEGVYDLDAIKKHYRKLVNSKIPKEIENNIDKD
ncbi:MAG: DUF2672 domain-containing protein [Rickettsiales bacterium]|nr:DUF2672 domain-containing protein [Rickettsiales bacterium]MCA0254326.1 DUF2672 domain-containing protein [Pseudomonadota bacterium]